MTIPTVFPSSARWSQPSTKMDRTFELIDEAIDGGHRVLLFSQFVRVLHLLRDEAARREIPFCYLDGQTVERQAEVDRFQNDAGISLSPHQPEGRRDRTESHRRGHGDSFRSVVESGGRRAGHVARSSHGPGPQRLRLQTDRRGDRRRENPADAGAQTRIVRGEPRWGCGLRGKANR